jgi:16S rRNA (guanine966-N2)-methyltransferase
MRIRIISGNFKGRFISVPTSKLLRPTTDRVRETLFNLLNNKIDYNELNILDLYSGSGSLGLEFISRGAKHITFVEKNSRIYRSLIENIKTLDIEASCKVIKSDVSEYSKRKPQVSFDLIIADPPYFSDNIYDVVKNLIHNNYLKEGGMIIVERSTQTKEKDILNFGIDPFKIIGDTSLFEINN